MDGQSARHRRIRGIMPLALVSVLTFVWGASPSWAQMENSAFVIATQASVTITSKTAEPHPASLRQNLFQDDVIKTGPNAATKILFVDNTILNVAERTEVEIDEFVFDPESVRRTTIFTMAHGTVKARVTAFYATTNSRFEIRTPTAVANAHGTEYVVWTFMQGDQLWTGIAVSVGSVTVTNRYTGLAVSVPAGQYTLVGPTTPPAPPALTATAPPDVQRQIQKSEVKTDPALIALVTVTMAQQANTAAAAITAAAKAKRAPAVTTSLAQQTVLPLDAPCSPVVSDDGTTLIGCK